MVLGFGIQGRVQGVCAIGNVFGDTLEKLRPRLCFRGMPRYFLTLSPTR